MNLCRFLRTLAGFDAILCLFSQNFSSLRYNKKNYLTIWMSRRVIPTTFINSLYCWETIIYSFLKKHLLS